MPLSTCTNKSDDSFTRREETEPQVLETAGKENEKNCNMHVAWPKPKPKKILNMHLSSRVNSSGSLLLIWLMILYYEFAQTQAQVQAQATMKCVCVIRTISINRMHHADPIPRDMQIAGTLYDRFLP